VPTDVVGEPSTDKGANEEAEAKDRAEEALIASPLSSGKQVPDSGQRDGEQCSRAQALQSSEQDQLSHVLRETAEQGSNEKNADTDQQERSAPVNITQLAVNRHGNCARQEIRRHDPGIQAASVKICDDTWQRCPNYVLVECTEEEPQQNSPQNSITPSSSELNVGSERRAILRLGTCHRITDLSGTRMDADLLHLMLSISIVLMVRKRQTIRAIHSICIAPRPTFLLSYRPELAGWVAS
jgi:hypothetical protein